MPAHSHPHLSCSFLAKKLSRKTLGWAGAGASWEGWGGNNRTLGSYSSEVWTHPGIVVLERARRTNSPGSIRGAGGNAKVSEICLNFSQLEGISLYALQTPKKVDFLCVLFFSAGSNFWLTTFSP